MYKETVDGYTNGIATFTPDVTGTYRIEYWHKEGDAAPVERSIKIVLVGDKRNTPSNYGGFTGDGHENVEVEW